MKTLKDLSAQWGDYPDSAKILIRADLNVPLEGCDVSDTTRIDAVLPTPDKLIGSAFE